VMALQGAAKLATGNGSEMLPSLVARSWPARRYDSGRADPIGAELMTYQAGRSATSIPSGLKGLSKSRRFVDRPHQPARPRNRPIYAD